MGILKNICLGTIIVNLLAEFENKGAPLKIKYTILHETADRSGPFPKKREKGLSQCWVVKGPKKTIFVMSTN